MTETPKISAKTTKKLLSWLVGKGRSVSLCVFFLTTLLLAFSALQVPIESNNASMVSHSKELQYNYDSFQLEDHEVLELLRPIPGEL